MSNTNLYEIEPGILFDTREIEDNRHSGTYLEFYQTREDGSNIYGLFRKKDFTIEEALKEFKRDRNEKH